MKLYKFLVKGTSTVYYEREIIAENEDKAIDEFALSLNDNDKTSEENFEVYDIENLCEAKEYDYD
jgi:hypothetical protein